MNIQTDLQKFANKKRALLVARYFKTGKGEYGEGDIFIGLTLPQIRGIAKKYKDLTLLDIEKLLQSPVHEYRLTALIMLTNKKLNKEIVDMYLRNTKYINNWDLVDVSAHKILGKYLVDKSHTILYKLARSKNIWERRIAVISTFTFFPYRDFSDSIQLADVLLHDTHDLMHKAVGWMLREIGKREEKILVDFLSTRYKKMPRTMLRYAIEKFDEHHRKLYLQGLI